MKTMLLTKIKLAFVVVVLMLGLVATGAKVLAVRTAAAQDKAPTAEARVKTPRKPGRRVSQKTTSARLRVLETNGRPVADNAVVLGTESYRGANLPGLSETPSHLGLISLDKLAAGTHWLLVRDNQAVLRIELPTAEEIVERRLPLRNSLVGKNLAMKVAVETKDDVEFIVVAVRNRTAEPIQITEADLQLMTAIKGPGADSRVMSPLWSKLAVGEPIPTTTIEPGRSETLRLAWVDWVKHGFWFSRDGEVLAEPTFPEVAAGKTWVRVIPGSALPVCVTHPDRIMTRDVPVSRPID